MACSAVDTSLPESRLCHPSIALSDVGLTRHREPIKTESKMVNDGLKANFKCKHCGSCCRIPGLVHLRSDEVVAIAADLELSVTDFTDRYTSLSSDRRGLVLKDNPDGSCILLDTNDLCQVNNVKPTQCRDFPFSWANGDSATRCPALADLQS